MQLVRMVGGCCRIIRTICGLDLCLSIISTLPWWYNGVDFSDCGFVASYDFAWA